MKHYLRFARTLAGISSIVLVAHEAEALRVAVPPRPAPVRNDARCPARRPAYGESCRNNQANLRCSYVVPGGAPASLVCERGNRTASLFWRVNPERRRVPPVVGPLTPPELS